ncbi:MAG: DUF3800 domain-containing protein [Gallionella sp.]|nr:DUF3800 domain-containing protein [Gallionella sp.]
MTHSIRQPVDGTIKGDSPEQFSLFSNTDTEAAETAANSPPTGRFSNFVVYVDESGDHGMQTVDSNYPVFVLAFCVFHKGHYCEKVVPALQKFKFNHFGHDHVVLHENEIRKEKGSFKFQSRRHKHEFLDQLTSIIEASNFILISCVIDKERLRDKQEHLSNPYHLALGFCLETLDDFLREKIQDNALTHVVVECRGTKEDNELELEFRRICDGANRQNKRLPFEVVFADKKTNSSGLQLADLVARPVGLSVLRPGQENRAFDVLKRKFFCSGGRDNAGEGFENWGLKIYPASESEKPR